jgi:signal transduction histidine kinase
LGDLLINVLLIIWITTFVKRHFDAAPLTKTIRFFAKRRKQWSAAALFLFAFITLAWVDIFCSFVLDSKIPLTVTDFFQLNFYTVITLCVFTFIVLSYFNISYIIFSITKSDSLLWKVAIVVVSALIIIALKRPSDTLSIQLYAVIWLAVYFLILQIGKNDLPRTLSASSYFLFWLMFFAASITAVIKATNSNETERRLKIAEDIASQTNSEKQFALKMTAGNFGSFFTDKNFMRFYSGKENNYLKDSLAINNFQDFMNKYQIALYTFDSLQNPLHNKDSASFADLNNLINNTGQPTNLPNFYLCKNKNDEYNYIYRKEITADSSAPVLGYLFLTVQPNPYAGNALPNELLQSSQSLNDVENYDYAIYKNRTLVRTNSSDYEFSDTIRPQQISINNYKEITNKKIRELWYNADNNYVIVVVQKGARFIDYVTLFAYIFLTLTILTVIIRVVNFIIRSRFKWRIMRSSSNFKMRTQIHITLIFISLFSFVIIGISTISFFILRYNKDRHDNLIKNIQVSANEIQKRDDSGQTFFSPSINYNALNKKAIEIANLNGEDINLYNREGLLQATSQPYIYNTNIASNRMQPEAFYQMRYKRRINFLQRETIGNFWYLSGYAPLYDDNKNVIAYLNIPSFRSQTALEQEISGFLVTIINLNALIFLLAGAIAALFTQRITKSYAYLKDEMRKINVDIENKEIEWNRNDEMGDLVREYNIMVQKLNTSVKALAQSEREGAWKEMARQVAHEIKNPLTPMMLNLQFMERAAHNDEYDIRGLSKKLPGILIEQINQLAKIADDFSQFASIYNIHPELFNLTDSLEALITLYRTNDKTVIRFTKPEEKMMIYSDKIQINRVFTNLLKNAMEAAEEQETTEIFIGVSRVENNAQVSVKDNGAGISKGQADKIFTPNFTTKTSGTGLGLAICKAIVENADGKIWFVSEENKGTTFFVSLPVKTVENV